jgi:hypothetical protein
VPSKWCESIGKCEYEESYLGDIPVIFKKEDGNKLSKNKIQIAKSSSLSIEYPENMVSSDYEKRDKKESKEDTIFMECEKIC